jgi:signal transduction histidine kinase
MHGIYTVKSLNSDTTAPLSRKVLGTVSALATTFVIAALGVSIVFLYPLVDAVVLRKVLVYLALLLVCFSGFILFLLSFLLQGAFFPLNELILWAKRADNLETIPVPNNLSKEIADIYEVFNVTLNRLKARQRLEAVDERERALLALASQVAHDIRSPLSALSLVSDGFSNLPEERRVLIRSAITRIQDIANNLLSKYRMNQQELIANEKPSVELLCVLTENLLSEKRAQFRTKPQLEIVGKVNAHSYGLFAQIQANEFMTVLSNLINNATEAIPDRGCIEVVLDEQNGMARLQVKDNGRGIPNQILTRLMTERCTYGKAGGLGLGLYHARRSVESWGGKLAIESTLGVGTAVTVTLPKALPPSWFLPSLKVSPRSTILVVDDDPSIHHTWDKKLSELAMEENGVSVKHFYNDEELSEWMRTKDKQTETLCLMDFELIGSAKNGIQILEALGMGGQSVLVTSRAEECGVLKDCQRLGIPVLPKSMVSVLPVAVRV